MRALRRKRGLLCGCLVCGVGVSIVLLRSAVARLRDDVNASTCQGNFCQLAVALNCFRERYGTYPPAYITDETGKPAHSWRVLVLPYIEQHEVFLKYDFAEPWNGPSNQKLHAATQRPGGQMFLCPSLDDPLRRRTTRFVVVRPSKLPALVKPAIAVATPNDQILLIEDHSAVVHWAEPRDLNAADLMGFAKSRDSSKLLSPHRRGVQYITCQGEYQAVLAPGSGEDEAKRLLGLDAPKDKPEPQQQEKDILMRILDERLRGTSPQPTRLVATLLLGQIGFHTPLARELLQNALRDPDPAVRKAAKLSLGKLPPEERNK